MSCLFCRIVAGTAPANLVLEAPGAVAFLDAFPSARPHVLVVPRTHAPTLVDLPDEELAGLFQAVKQVQQRVTAVFEPLGFHVGWNHGYAAGQRVDHLHVHVLPRYADGGRGVQTLGSGADRTALDELAAKLRGS